MGRGSSKSGKSGGGKFGMSDKEIRQSLHSLNLLSKEDIPQLHGTPKQIEKATKIRKEMSSGLLYYSRTRDSDGNPIGDSVFKGLVLTKDENKKVEFIKQRAQSLAGGNDKLIPEKIKHNIEAQNDLVARYHRYVEVMTNNSSAAWWVSQGDTLIAQITARRYIDGKGWDTMVWGKKKK